MLLIRNKYVRAAFVVLAVLYCYTEADGKGDFFIFLSAADDLNRGVNIFEATYVDGYHYYYSVLFALMLKPLLALPFVLIKTLWLVLNLSLFVHLLVLLSRSYYVKQLANRQRTVFFLLIIIFSFRFVFDNIHLSQVTILIFWCCVYGLYLVFKNKPVQGALLLALGINIKLLPIVFIPYLFYRGYFKAGSLIIIFYLLFLFAPSLIIGHEYNLNLVKTWLHLINPTNQKHILDVEERTFHGLSTLLSTLLVKDVPDVYALTLKRNIMDLPLTMLSQVLLFVRLALVLFALYFTRFSFFKKAKTNWQACIEVSYILMIIPLIFPHQQPYAFLFVIPSVACICYFLIAGNVSKNAFRLFLFFLTLIFLSFSLKILLGEYNQYYDHFKILTYGALLLIPLLAWVWKYSQKVKKFIF
ncbi:MAG: glycosyltransferase family 87 protein [Bacteroidia bacterium]